MDVKEYVTLLKNSITYIRSVDGFLVKLGSIVYEIEGICQDGTCDPVEVFKQVLYDDELVNVLKRFSCYKEEIRSAIERDPRHKILRKYVSIICERLGSIECVREESLETLTPPPTWFKEYREKPVIYEESSFGRKSSIMAGFRERVTGDNLENVVKILLVISMILFVITLILIIIS